MKARLLIAVASLAACSSEPLPIVSDDVFGGDVSEGGASLDVTADTGTAPDVETQDVEPDTEPSDVVTDAESDVSDVLSDADRPDADASPDAEFNSDSSDAVESDATEPDAVEDIVFDATAPDVETDTELDLADTAADSSIDTASELPSLDEILAALREDGESAAYGFARSNGWPIEVEGGYLIVSFDARSTAVAGDFDEWTGQSLIIDSGFAYRVVTASPDDGYKLSDGDVYRADPLARSYVLDEFGELSKIAPTTVHFDRWNFVTDGVVAPRQVNVRVPESAATHVLYAHDGQNLFDDSRASFGVSWDLAASVPDGVMVVGIDHGPNRIYEYTWIEDDLRGTPSGGGAGEYADFLQTYLRPFIDSAYEEPPTAGVMGSSLGGLVSLYIAHRFPGEFDMAISLSGTLGWGSFGAHQETLLELYQAAGVRPTRLYVDSGGGVDGECVDLDGDGVLDDNDTGADNYCTNRQFADAMASLGYTWAVDLWHWWEPDAPHNEAAWAARVFRPLGYFAE